MRKIFVVLSFTLLITGSLAAQQAATPAPAAPQEDKLFTSASDLTALIAKAKSERKEGQPMVNGRILHVAPYTAYVEVRLGLDKAAAHLHDAEIWYVVDGSGTMILGGKLVDENSDNKNTHTGSSIEGGQTRQISKGDFIFIPENTPHWISSINGEIDLMTMHMPGPSTLAQQQHP